MVSSLNLVKGMKTTLDLQTAASFKEIGAHDNSPPEILQAIMIQQ